VGARKQCNAQDGRRYSYKSDEELQQQQPFRTLRFISALHGSRVKLVTG